MATDFQQLQRDFAAHLRDPARNAAPDGLEDRRVAVYRELFYNNIEGLLAGNFPVIRRITPDAQWHALARGFYAEHASHTPLFTEIGREFHPDVVLLDGYLYVLTRPMLEAYRNRLLNLHFSDLTLRTTDRRPAYAGIRAVRDAIADGLQETSATVHLVNEEPDGGPPLVCSWSFGVPALVADARRWGAADMLKAYAFAHQEWMIRAASGPLLAAALHLVASGHVDLDQAAATDPSRAVPWLLDEHGRLTPPAAARMQGILDGYKRVSA